MERQRADVQGQGELDRVMVALKVAAVGNSVALILPDAVQARLKVAVGDSVHLVETPFGYELTLSDVSRHEQQMKIAREIMDRRESALRELAK